MSLPPLATLPSAKGSTAFRFYHHRGQHLFQWPVLTAAAKFRRWDRQPHLVPVHRVVPPNFYAPKHDRGASVETPQLCSATVQVRIRTNSSIAASSRQSMPSITVPLAVSFPSKGATPCRTPPAGTASRPSSGFGIPTALAVSGSDDRAVASA